MSDYYITTIDYGTPELEHHGIIGMKWGVRRTAAQLGHTSRANKKRAKQLKKARAAKKKKKEEQAKQLKKAREKRKAQNDELDKAIAKGNINAIRKLAAEGKLTDKQLERFSKRIGMQRAIDDMELQKSKASSAKIGQMASKMGSVSTMLQNGVNIYNNIAKIHNALDPNNPMQVVGQDFIDANKIAADRINNSNNLRIAKANQEKLDAAEKAASNAKRQVIKDKVKNVLKKGKSADDSDEESNSTESESNKPKRESKKQKQAREAQEQAESEAAERAAFKKEREAVESKAEAWKRRQAVATNSNSTSDMIHDYFSKTEKSYDQMERDANQKAMEQAAKMGNTLAQAWLEDQARKGY